MVSITTVVLSSIAIIALVAAGLVWVVPDEQKADPRPIGRTQPEISPDDFLPA
jgi:hypothetical protein